MRADDSLRTGAPRVESDVLDLERMRRLRLGDPAALDRLMHDHWAPLVRYATRLVGSTDAAEDIVQETFVSIWRQRATWKSSGSVRAYLYRITRNLALKERRHRSVRDRWSEWLKRDARPVATPYDTTRDEEIRAAFDRALATLPPRRREAFVLSRYHELSLAEIAGIMGISTQTVANQVSAALADLRRALGHLAD
jgi:RNA polymerase sigma-70 factor (ECF subfamily)